MIVGNGDAPNILGYYATDSGSDIENLSPVTLMVWFEIRIPQAYKPGIGRPDFRAVTSGAVGEWQAFKNVSVAIEGGEPNKGMIYKARASMAPGSRITLELVGVDFSRDMLQNYVEFGCTDDWGGASNVVALTRVRPRDEASGEVEQVADAPAPVQDVYAITIGGNYARVGIEEHSQFLPPGVIYNVRQTANGTRGFLTNVGTVPWTMYAMYCVFDTTGFYAVGERDGEVWTYSDHARTAMVFNLGPGLDMCFEPNTFAVKGNYNLITFIRKPYSERYTQPTV